MLVRLLLATVLLSAASGAASAQRVNDVPARPPLPSGGDSNSAVAYYNLGVERLRTNPSQAAAAFYWAGRLNPESAEYPYARRLALMLTDPRRLTMYFGLHPSFDPQIYLDPEVRAIDSLVLRSRRLDPFLHTRLDDIFIIELWRTYVAEVLRREGASFEAYDTEQWARAIADANPGIYAWMLFARGHFQRANDYWGRVARRNPRSAIVRVDRARAFYLTGAYDSARAEITQALAIARRADADSLRFVYESKAAWEYSLGRILERQANTASAREAFERALTEDLSYYPAHIQLGMLHIERGDTAAALREFARAVGVKDDEYVPRATYGFFLANSGQLDSALTQIRRAIEIEPHAAQPRMMLGAVLDAKGDQSAAATAFEAYLARASRVDPDLETVRARLQQLRSGR